jgi:hypothetical protein
LPIPPVFGPFSLEARLALVREELGDDIWLVVIDAASMGLQTVLTTNGPLGSTAPVSASIARHTITVSFITAKSPKAGTIAPEPLTRKR